MKYEIVATLGPASQKPDIWNEMVAIGVTAFRLNTSHLSLEQLDNWLNVYGQFYQRIENKPPLIFDLQGNKWRLGEITAGTLVEGQNVWLRYGTSSDAPTVLPVPHEDFFRAAVSSTGDIVLNDGKVLLCIESIENWQIKAVVTKSGPISSRKGITYASSAYRSESLNEKDQKIVNQYRQCPFIRYAISYVRDSQEMSKCRDLIQSDTYLIAKLERASAVGDATSIAQYADELWLCRGDLGAESGLTDMARQVAEFSGLIDNLKLPVFMAGQVLEHMTMNNSPTRSEVCFLYDTIVRGYRGIVLSDETAIGKNPLEACRIAAMFR